MADKYVDTLTEAGKHTAAAFVHGDKTVVMVATEEIAVADNDGDVFRLWKSIPSDLIPVRIEIYNDAIASGTDYDLGFYESTVDGVDGTVIDADKLANTLDMSSAAGRGSPKDGLENLNIDEVRERIYELSGDTLDTVRAKGYDIALTANTVGSAIGTISAIGWFVQG